MNKTGGKEKRSKGKIMNVDGQLKAFLNAILLHVKTHRRHELCLMLASKPYPGLRGLTPELTRICQVSTYLVDMDILGL